MIWLHCLKQWCEHVCISCQIIRAKLGSRLCYWQQNAFLLVCCNRGSNLSSSCSCLCQIYKGMLTDLFPPSLSEQSAYVHIYQEFSILSNVSFYITSKLFRSATMWKWHKRSSQKQPCRFNAGVSQFLSLYKGTFTK